MKMKKTASFKTDHICIEGASGHNLKDINLKIPLHKLVVVTGVSGSGKSSLAFDTVYAEGQRRYVETFSSYARQFLDRMDKPHVKRIIGIPPAIAIDQNNPVRTSRSTVGTMSELNDYFKLLFARAAHLHCPGCAKEVRKETAQSIADAIIKSKSTESNSPVLICFAVAVPANFGENEVIENLATQGYRRVHQKSKQTIEVIQDRVHPDKKNRERIIEDIEAALQFGMGKIAVYPLHSNGEQAATAPLRFSSGLHCADCDLHFKDPVPNDFSFNSALGACEKCRGFGRVIGVDYSLVIPDTSKSLQGGAIRPWQTESYRECQDDLIRFAKKRSVPINKPWRDLSDKHKEWVIRGEGGWDEGLWYGVKRFFEWLESRSYKMHIRVLLSRYRTYSVCPSCSGARLKPHSLAWRLGKEKRYSIHELMSLCLQECLEFFLEMKTSEEPVRIVLDEIRTRLRYLNEVGLGYLTLDRQSRTLSGGEVQRINLTTALGTSLVNTLFILDEPSIGLHPEDIGRLTGVLKKLRDAGNSLIVVEHDPEIILSADYVIEMGPKPGKQGGEVVFSGPIKDFLKCKNSLTADYLRGTREIRSENRKPMVSQKSIRITGACEHNLQNIDVSIPLGRLVCITGVSGSGKSTLVDSVLYRGWKSICSKGGDTPGAHKNIKGTEHIDEMIFVDQSPIGKTTRSNPASYVGSLDPIRKLFASTTLSKERGYTAGTFSFNSGNGRCPACSGNGFEHVEMQFLSDVYIRCEECNGTRYRAQVLEVTIEGDNAKQLSIADVLQMTVGEACAFFSSNAPILRKLQPLLDVGLSYLTLGQPVPTLSGGEAQRLKLAGHLSGKSSNKKGEKGALFIFDEPTTGLHFEDISVLIQALRRLVAAGDSVLVIEHNIDVIRTADWIIDLGPGGGKHGGQVVCTGTPDRVAACKTSLTAKALRADYRKSDVPISSAQYSKARKQQIAITHAREHNLKDIDITIPQSSFTVITGVSGSGKSTVAFDILFAEGQRRYLESLNAYARQFVQPAARADFDLVTGVPPTVAIEQRTSRGGRKSTVATVTEIYHYIRLLYVKLGIQYCPGCNIAIEPRSRESIVASLLNNEKGRVIEVLATLVSGRKGIYKDLAAWAQSKKIEFLRVDGEMLPTANWPVLDRYREHTIELPVGKISVQEKNIKEIESVVAYALQLGKGTIKTERKNSRKATVYSTQRNCPGCGRGFEELDPRLFSFNSRHGWCPACYGTGLEMKGFDENQSGEEIWWNEWWDGGSRVCQKCNGKRLRQEALSVEFMGNSISETVAFTIDQSLSFFADLKLAPREKAIAENVITELLSRLSFLSDVGLGYLSLDRAAPTLSGGEAQRIRLASQLGSNLQGVCYILDEPTIGLHPRDNAMLLKTLFKLKSKGNTIVVVEHDEETIRNAEYLIDLGPGGGKAGGYLLSQGTLKQMLSKKRSPTAKYLNDPLVHSQQRLRPVSMKKGVIKITKASMHNLKGVDVSIPLHRLVCVSGVSGSGKSTLVRDILYENLKHCIGKKDNRGKTGSYSGCKNISGYESVCRAIEVDQSPIGKTPRSCPATYVGLWDNIRKLYASLPEANLRGFSPSRFSFNVEGGRCSECGGQGVKKVEMSFLPDVTVQCEECNGARFTKETMAVLYKGRSIGDVLSMSVDEAVDFFSPHQAIFKTLKLLQDVGLGYISLGQPSPALSGGEAQRVKLVSELARSMPAKRFAKKGTGSSSTLYVLDEPTIGLHIADIDKLIGVLHRLVDAGNTVVVIEHDLDIIAEADWVIDLGPEGGDKGGDIVAQGTPWEIAEDKRSYTASFLKKQLRRG